MKRVLKRRFAFRNQAGLTLVEILVSTAAGAVLMLGIFGLMRSVNVLSAKSLATNSTGTEARNVLDRVNSTLELSNNNPSLVDSDGTLTSGSAALTGTTKAGIAFDRGLGGPYILSGSTTVPATATSISFICDTAAQIRPPAPVANDILLINTTAVLSGTANQLRAPIQTVTGASTAGNKVTYTVTLTGTIGGTGIPAQTNSVGQPIPISAFLVRPTAFLVVSSSTSGPQLRYYDSYKLTGGKLDVTGSNSVLTYQIDTQTADAAPFSLSSTTGKVFASMRLRIRSSRYDSVLNKKQRDGFATFMGLDSITALKCDQE